MATVSVGLPALSKNLYLALIHSPVVNRNKEIVVSSVTNLDLHDIARAGRTYGIGGYFVVHPSPDQQALNRRIIRHWNGAFGDHANPTRRKALELIDLVDSAESAIQSVIDRTGKSPLLVGTSAKKAAHPQSIEPKELHEKLATEVVLLFFGTAYGLAAEISERLEAFLPPISGGTDFNHLSVRSAVSIYLDRIFGERP